MTTRRSVTALMAAACIAAALACSGCMTIARAFPPSEEKTPLERCQTENAALKEELAARIEVGRRLAYDLEMTRIELQRAQAAAVAGEAPPAPLVQAFQDYVVMALEFGILTGPADWDGQPGYDGIQAYILPKDGDGSTIKRKGNCVFDLIDISRRDQRVVMSWSLPAEELGTHWSSIPPGFRIKLPWQGEVPWGDEVILRATFTDSFGRSFAASRTFRLARQKTPDEKEKQPTQ